MAGGFCSIGCAPYHAVRSKRNSFDKRRPAKAGSADFLVRTASEAGAAFSRFALIADEDVRAPSNETGIIEAVVRIATGCVH